VGSKLLTTGLLVNLFNKPFPNKNPNSGLYRSSL